MSDQIKAKREWRFYLQDMTRFAQNVQTYTEGMNQADFVTSGINYDATLRNLELIGEAATHVPQDIQTQNIEIPWRLVIATRNRLIHGYLGIDDDTVWNVIQEDIPFYCLPWNKYRPANNSRLTLCRGNPVLFNLQALKPLQSTGISTIIPVR